MRIVIYGLIAATAALCTGCGPSPGSPEWCKANSGNLQAMQQNPQAMQQCVMAGLQEMQKQLQDGTLH